MLNKKALGDAIAAAIKMKIESGAVKTQREIADHFKVKPPSVSDWKKKGSIEKDKLPELFRYFSDVAGPSHWGLTEDEWPKGLPIPTKDKAGGGGKQSCDQCANKNPGKVFVLQSDNDSRVPSEWEAMDINERRLLIAWREGNPHQRESLMALALLVGKTVEMQA